MNITLRDFWSSHKSDYLPDYPGDVTKSFLIDLVRQIDVSGDKPIVITSVFKTTSLSSKLVERFVGPKKNRQSKLYQGSISSKPSESHFNLWYTAENVRPILDSNFDAFLSYDLDPFSGTNQYLPLWLCRLGPTVKMANEKQISLTKSRKMSSPRVKNFAVVASNPEQIRSYFIRSLSRNENVEIFGKLGKKISNKNEALKDFNFNICFENDLYPGYVTEKAVEAYMSGCIPVWRGLDTGKFLNQDAIIDVTNLSIEEAVSKVLQVSKEPELISQMRSAPLLNRTINLDEIIMTLLKIYQAK